MNCELFFLIILNITRRNRLADKTLPVLASRWRNATARLVLSLVYRHIPEVKRQHGAGEENLRWVFL